MHNVAGIDPFHAIAISREAHALEEQGRSILHMEFGQPSTGAPTRARSPRTTFSKRAIESDACSLR